MGVDAPPRFAHPRPRQCDAVCDAARHTRRHAVTCRGTNRALDVVRVAWGGHPAQSPAQSALHAARARYNARNDARVCVDGGPIDQPHWYSLGCAATGRITESASDIGGD